jgi:hypothetical protein
MIIAPGGGSPNEKTPHMRGRLDATFDDERTETTE